MIILPPFASSVTASLTRNFRFRVVFTGFFLIYILATIAVNLQVLAWPPTVLWWISRSQERGSRPAQETCRGWLYHSTPSAHLTLR